MKIRTDFVTNSSSSSFIVYDLKGCKELADYLRKLIVKYGYADENSGNYHSGDYYSLTSGCNNMTIDSDSVYIKCESLLDDCSGYYPEDDFYGFSAGAFYGPDECVLDNLADAFLVIAEKLNFPYRPLGTPTYKMPSKLSDEEYDEFRMLCEDNDIYCAREYVLGDTD